MRKAQKQEILNLLDNFDQAHEEIKNAINRRDHDLAEKMLGECQEFAVSLGESIEELEGQGHVTVSCLEEYCELLYRIFQEIAGNIADGAKIFSSLRQQLERVRQSVVDDIRVRKEVAFFPYKASMWDSLESVYLAAREDPDCDAYCVPIPYYELNPDHSFGQMCYEGAEYPENIEVTDWQAYRFEDRKPDMIFIHNPYDHCNIVTSVHPRFYSENLKKYTEKLIYIPYFVMGELDPDDEKAIESKGHFCFLPGTINADRVIVESEHVRQLYINEYIKAARAGGLPENFTDRKQVEKKFLALGSPKFDRVAAMCREDVNIPAEWERHLIRPDGSRKKSILYNNSITTFLKQDEKMLRKLKEILDVFKEYQDDIVLWWRPHPLIQSTLKTMRPQLWQPYQELVQKYREENWGIYDDTADLNRAIACTDAYYGDWSSVVQLYEKTEKPIMIAEYENSA